MKNPTVVDEVTDKLAYRIAAGVYTPGEMLPSVRQVAAEFDISAPTANTVLGRLATAGFADAHRGLGYVVRDIRLYGGIETWRYVFRFSSRLPDTAAKIFADIMEADQMVLFQTIRTIAADPRRYDPSPVARAVDRLELLVSGERVDLTEIVRAQLHALRTLLATVGQLFFLGLFNSIGEMLIEIPEAGKAFYAPAGPELHVVFCRQLLTAWESGMVAADDDIAIYEALFGAYRQEVVRHFRQFIAERSSEAQSGETQAVL